MTSPLKVGRVSFGRCGFVIDGDTDPCSETADAWGIPLVFAFFTDSILALTPIIFAVTVSDSSISLSISPGSQHAKISWSRSANRDDFASSCQSIIFSLM